MSEFYVEAHTLIVRWRIATTVLMGRFLVGVHQMAVLFQVEVLCYIRQVVRKGVRGSLLIST